MLDGIVSLFGQSLSTIFAFLRNTRLSYGGFSLSLWDLSISFMLLCAVIMICLPWFHDDDD